MSRTREPRGQQLRLLALCPYYPPHLGGLEKYAQELHEQLADCGHRLTVLTANIPSAAPQEFSHNKRVKIIRLPARELVYNFPWPRFTAAARETIRRVLREPFDAVLSTTRFFITSPLAGLIARRQHLPWLHIEHGSDYVTSHNLAIRTAARLCDETVGRRVLRHADAVVAPSQSAAAFVQHLTGRQVPVIYRGLPLTWLNNIRPAPRHYPPHVCHLLYAGRFITSKGLPDLLRAISQLPRLPLHLTLAGSGSQEENLKVIVEELRLQGKVSFAGSLTPEQSIALIKSADIIVNPSYNEGLPTLVLEAAACGKAIIATHVGGTSEIVADGTSACLINPRSPEQLAKSIQRLASQPALRRQLGESAAVQVKQKFNWDTAAAAYEQVLWQIVKSTYAA